MWYNSARKRPRALRAIEIPAPAPKTPRVSHERSRGRPSCGSPSNAYPLGYRVDAANGLPLLLLRGQADYCLRVYSGVQPSTFGVIYWKIRRHTVPISPRKDVLGKDYCHIVWRHLGLLLGDGDVAFLGMEPLVIRCRLLLGSRDSVSLNNVYFL